MMKEANPDWRIHSYEVHTKEIVQDLEIYKDFVREADIIITQPIWDNYRDTPELSTKWIFENRSQSSVFVKYPSIFFRGAHPSQYYLRDATTAVHSYGVPYHDLTLLYLMSKGVGLEGCIAAMCSPDLFSQQFIEGEFDRSIAELSKREAAESISIPLSQWLDRHGRERPLFHVINHPFRPVLAFVANAVISAIGAGSPVSEEGKDYIAKPHIPVSPSVISHLNLIVSDSHGFFRLSGQTEDMSRAVYYKHVFDMMSAKTPSELTDLIQRYPDQAAFIGRLEGDRIRDFVR
jgi:hypothetical protein